MDDEIAMFLLFLAAAFIVFVVILNPLFWQGFRNSKYIDSLKESKKDDDLLNVN